LGEGGHFQLGPNGERAAATARVTRRPRPSMLSAIGATPHAGPSAALAAGTAARDSSAK
jgi:hypothetical protein